MAVDVTSAQAGYDGRTPAGPLRVVGSFVSVIPFSVSGAGVGATSDTATVIFPGLKVIKGCIVQARKIADGSGADNDATIYTFSGNTLTIVEEGAGTIETNVYSGFVWGDVALA
jgi:hypothetical protein